MHRAGQGATVTAADDDGGDRRPSGREGRGEREDWIWGRGSATRERGDLGARGWSRGEEPEGAGRS